MTEFPIREVNSIRDLLIVGITAELDHWLADNGNLAPHPGADPIPFTQAIVAFVIDSITPHSLELLAELHAKQTAGRPPPKQH